MIKKQIETLKLLGYRDTDEDGAVLVHHGLWELDSWVCPEDTFDEIMEAFTFRFERSLRIRVSTEIRNW
jgi:hypothetical protein